jgi:hypothetical protein
MNTEQRLLRKRIWSRPWFIVLSVLVLIIAILLFYRLSQKSALDKKLDEISAAGYPSTCEELDEWYSIPPGQKNAADPILDAIAAFQQWPQQDMEDLPFVGTGYPPSRTETITEPTKEIIAEYLADNAKSLELLHKASQISHCRFPVDYTAGFNTTINYLGEFRQSFHLIALEASFHAQNNQPDAAIESISTLFSLARFLEKEPLIISQLVRIACQTKALEALEYVINQIKFSDQQLNAISRTIEDTKNPDAMLYGFAGERACGMDIFTKPTEQKLALLGGQAIPASLIPLYAAIGMADQDAISYLDIMSKSVQACKLPLKERLEVAKSIDTEIGEIPKIRYLAKAMTPAVARVTEMDCRIMSRLDGARVALAVERYRLANGKLPESLKDLVPTFLESVPIDPFDSKPLKYKKLDPGFVIYSIGEDRQDDGGKERGPDRKKPNDATFIIER